MSSGESYEIPHPGDGDAHQGRADCVLCLTSTADSFRADRVLFVLLHIASVENRGVLLKTVGETPPIQKRSQSMTFTEVDVPLPLFRFPMCRR